MSHECSQKRQLQRVSQRLLANGGDAMIHLGDITKIKGDNIPQVDVITFGSPCQDLSIAGKRVGLSGERSGLFMEAVRIIKEMREATNEEYPKYAVWENVPGAFSSNKGEDIEPRKYECGFSDRGFNKSPEYCRNYEPRKKNKELPEEKP